LKLTQRERIVRTLKQTKRDHGFYWIIPNDSDLERLAEWAYLGAAGEEVWFLPGDQDYLFDKEVSVVSGRRHEPSAPLISKIRDLLGLRDERRNVRLY
jgi:hypothetical protein